jgi:uncharacterized protein YyaL (SSP411 family)
MACRRDGRWRRRRGAIAGLAIASLASLAGCGDSAESGPPSGPAGAVPADDPSVNSNSNPDSTMNQHASGHGSGDGDRTPNRLVDETSPYLLQHAWNPVDWRPWGPEAFEEARRRDVPIIVSIGYSTCYWCHVMERESFEDPAVAEIMNRDFVCIKVDREQRPDVDEIHMAACQIYTQATEGRPSGGWPLNAFLNPDNLEPFLVGTYFPPEPAYGRPSFKQLLQNVASAWASQREEIAAQAGRIAALVREQLSARVDPTPLDPGLAARTAAGLLQFHDAEQGGFGGAPKFPQPVYLELLLEVGGDSPELRAALSRTLDRMAVGGIHDQVAGGFHRYSVDAEWTVPHFEKMLYDNGQLASIYAEAHARTGDPYHAEVVRGILDYVGREMTDADGAFWSAQDAEVDTREGGTQIWTEDEMRSSLVDAGLASDVDFALALYGLDGGANFRDPHHPDAPPSNVLRLRDRPEAIAAAMGMDPAAFAARRATVDAALLATREGRPQPALDDKILASWNGLMIRGFADGGRVLGEPAYIDAADRAADAVLARLGRADGGLNRTARGEVVQIDAFLEDYALMAEGLLALHRATGDPRRNEQAAALVEAARERFWNDERGGWYDTQAGQSDLIVRASNISDGAVPSGAGTMLLNVIELAKLTDDPRYLDTAEAALAGMSGGIAANPSGAARSVIAVERLAAIDPARLPRGSAGSTGATGADVASTSEPAVRPDVTVVEPSIIEGDEPGSYRLRIDIPEGQHVNAHEPGGDTPESAGLVGLSLQVVSGGSIEVTWPAGEPWRDGVRVHEGRVEIPFVVAPDDADSTVVFVVGWQACDDRVCFRPEQREFAIRP